MTDSPPVWLMDVDGVINMFGVRMPGPNLRTFKSANGYSITYRLDLLERLAELHRTGKVEIQWLTTWEELADEHLAEELGLPRGLKVAGTYADADPAVYWWKLGHVKSLYEQGHRIVWTDDDIAWTDEALDWLDTVEDSRLTFQSPDPGYGITDEFVELVEEWL